MSSLDLTTCRSWFWFFLLWLFNFFFVSVVAFGHNGERVLGALFQIVSFSIGCKLSLTSPKVHPRSWHSSVLSAVSEPP